MRTFVLSEWKIFFKAAGGNKWDLITHSADLPPFSLLHWIAPSQQQAHAYVAVEGSAKTLAPFDPTLFNDAPGIRGCCKSIWKGDEDFISPWRGLYITGLSRQHLIIRQRELAEVDDRVTWLLLRSQLSALKTCLILKDFDFLRPQRNVDEYVY